MAPPPNVPVTITTVWQYTVMYNGTIVVSEVDPDEWIIAAEYTKVGPGEEYVVTLVGPPVTSKKADDQPTEP